MSRATHQKAFQSTFIAEEPKNRKKARLSWYHPDDTVRPELMAGVGRHPGPSLTQTCFVTESIFHTVSEHHCTRMAARLALSVRTRSAGLLLVQRIAATSSAHAMFA